MVNINNVLCEVISSFYNSFVEKNITPKIDLPKETVRVIGNEGAIKRVLSNLTINVINHSKEDICISLKKENNKVIVTTINRCENINNDEVDLLFNRFYKKEDIARTNNNGSAGLGLSIAKSLMEKMNGKIYSKYEDNLLYISCEWKLK